jgi:hypothetical protein
MDTVAKFNCLLFLLTTQAHFEKAWLFLLSIYKQFSNSIMNGTKNNAKEKLYFICAQEGQRIVIL